MTKSGYALVWWAQIAYPELAAGGKPPQLAFPGLGADKKTKEGTWARRE